MEPTSKDLHTQCGHVMQSREPTRSDGRYTWMVCVCEREKERESQGNLCNLHDLMMMMMIMMTMI